MAEAILNAPTRSLRSLPGMRHLAILAGLVAAVAVGVMTWSYTQKPGLAPLVSGLDPKDAAAVADALRTANIEFQADAATGAISVTGDKLLDARMKLAAAGLPKSSSMGFEMIQQEQGFGTSQFIENARYQHALETELARTVSSLQSVQNARVHLALPKQSVFAGAGNAASASVLLDLAAGRSLDSTQVDSIVHLVASSVPNLAASNVTVIDQYGHLLNSSGDADDPARRASKEFEQKRRVETDLVRRIEQLLMPLTGAGRVSAQVVADMDFSEVEEASETYKPDSAVVRSEQTSEDVSRAPGSGSANAQGIPGATSNQPPNAAQAKPLNPPAAVAAAKQGATSADASTTTTSPVPLTENRNSTRNYELDRTVSHVKRPGGTIKRLSVAVLVDNLPKTDDKGVVTTVALTPEQLTKVQDLVKQAVGFDDKRGDTLSVQNAAFAAQALPPAESELIWQNPLVRDIARRVIGAAVLIALIVMVLKPAFKFLSDSPLTERLSATVVGDRAVAGGNAQAAFAPTTVMEELPKAMPAYEQKLNQARGAVSQDPKRVAQIVKTWVNPDG